MPDSSFHNIRVINKFKKIQWCFKICVGAIYGLKEVRRLGLHSYCGNMNCAPYSFLFCSVFFCVLCWLFFEHMLFSGFPEPFLSCLSCYTWLYKSGLYKHRLLSNHVFVSEIGIITTSRAITHYLLALTLIRRLHRELFNEDKTDKNAVLSFHLFSGIMRW